MQNSTRYYDIYEEYGLKHYQVPKVFFTNELYKSIPTDAKLAWAILRDRFTLSKSNGWFEKDTGRIYFIYTNKDLMNILNVKSETTVTKLKKSLINAGLLEQKRMGLNSPNRLYLLKPVVSEKDIYKITKLEEVPDKKKSEPIPPKKKQKSVQNNGTTENEVPANTLDKNGTSKNDVPSNPLINLGTPINEVQEPQNMEPSDTEYSNTDSLKENIKIDTYKDTEKAELSTSEHEMIKREREKIFKETLRDKMPNELFHTLSILSENYDEMSKWFSILLRAKDKIYKERNLNLNLNDINHELNRIVASGIRAIKKDTHIKNPDNYLFVTIYNGLDQMIHHYHKNNPRHAAFVELFEKDI